MKKRVGFWIILLSILTGISPVFAEGFYIKNYEVKVKINRDLSLDIEENLHVYFTELRRGILRTIPYRYDNGRETTIFRVEVPDNEFQVSTKGNDVVIRIGSPTVYLNGDKTYTIRYHVLDAINFFENHAEFYWNLIGTQWEVPIQKASFRVEFDEDIGLQPADYIGIRGKLGSKQAQPLNYRKGVLWGATEGLRAYEGVTAVVRIPSHYFRFDKDTVVQQAKNYYVKDYRIHMNIRADAVIAVREEITLHSVASNTYFSRYIDDYNYQTGDRALLSKNLNKDVIFGVKKSPNMKVRRKKKTLTAFYMEQTQPGMEETLILEYKIFGRVEFNKTNEYISWQFKDVGGSEPIRDLNITIDLPYENKDNIVTANITTTDKRLGAKPMMDIYPGVKSVKASTVYGLRGGTDVQLFLNMPRGYFRRVNLFRLVQQWQHSVPKAFLPVYLFFIGLVLWIFFGKDKHISLMVEYMPPEDLTPAEAGYIIDDIPDNRDLISLLFYWGANGYMRIDRMKGGEYEFVKLKDLPSSARSFEKTIFNGIFSSGKSTKRLSSLKNQFYSKMETAKQQLEAEIKSRKIYVSFSRVLARLFKFIGNFAIFCVCLNLFISLTSGRMLWLAVLVWVAIMIIAKVFAKIMPKKTDEGQTKYMQLKGFEEFIRRAEQSQLKRLMEENSGYFDKTVPYALAFGMLDEWAGHFKDLLTGPPDWYQGEPGKAFEAGSFAQTIQNSVNSFNSVFISTPPPPPGSSSGRSSGRGSSWSGGSSSSSGGGFSSGSSGFGGGSSGGGYSGGGGGGGGGSSW